MLTKLATRHGLLELPAFFPDATRGVIRSVSSEDLEACGTQALMVNAFHLLNKPGSRTVAEHGGMHGFMNWQRPIAADSGGFQVYSLLENNPKMGSITPKGFIYRLEKGGEKIILTPEKCVQAQFRLGADILFCLDYCTHPDAPAEQQRQAVEHTVSWAGKCRETYDRLVEQKGLAEAERPLLFGVVQGGEDPDLRRECAERLLEIGFDGYGYGGWTVNADGVLAESAARVAELIPEAFPRFALGVGKPENVVRAFRLGYRLFDCVIPTRDARHRRLYVFEGDSAPATWEGKEFYDQLYMQDRKHAKDGGPVEEGCDCLCCQNYSRGYLHHLFRVRDALADRLATIHNLRFYRRLMDALTAEDEAAVAP